MVTLAKILNSLFGLLPDNPFAKTIETLTSTSNSWSYIAYFVPIQAIVTMTTTWAVAMGAYYVWSAVSSWLRKVG